MWFMVLTDVTLTDEGDSVNDCCRRLHFVTKSAYQRVPVGLIQTLDMRHAFEDAKVKHERPS